MRINVKGPAGNVHVIMGAYQSLIRQLGNSATEEQRALLKDYQDMDYENIMDAVERLSHGTITFIGRSKRSGLSLAHVTPNRKDQPTRQTK